VSTARPRADNGSPYLFPFTYGYIESRMKFPGTAGFFTAFWMLPTNPSFTYDTEIDIVEILGGHPDTVFMTYHYNGRSTSFTPKSGPMQLILHMMVDNQWERDWGSVLSSQTLVRQLEVDYIRIYQLQ
jgi:hypothetical protein